jgi:hypothetical protein
VGHLGADVDHVGVGGDGVEVLGEGLPAPADALAQRGAGDVLDALHQADEPVVAIGCHRGEPDAAVAHHHGGDAVPARRRQQGVPGGLAVVVGVDVDEPGRDQGAVGVDLLAGRAGDTADLGDAPAGDGDVRGPGGVPRPVDDRAAPDDQIVHRTPP